MHNMTSSRKGLNLEVGLRLTVNELKKTVDMTSIVSIYKVQKHKYYTVSLLQSINPVDRETKTNIIYILIIL